MTLRQSINEATMVEKLWNRVTTWNGYTLASVQWHWNGREPWKVLPNGTTFEQAADRNFQPIAEFHTQRELRAYLLTETTQQAQ